MLIFTAPHCLGLELPRPVSACRSGQKLCKVKESPIHVSASKLCLKYTRSLRTGPSIYSCAEVFGSQAASVRTIGRVPEWVVLEMELKDAEAQ